MATPVAVQKWRSHREPLQIFLKPGVRQRIKSAAHSRGQSIAQFLEQIADSTQWPDPPAVAA
ncbi:MAG: hypothetical protein HOL17_06220 [Gammaproteobacteria bacterium]|jgi:uncharacterized protein (DUF1778 family)|nr:hypothetical protein [Gammaproteobacteria bacterium]MBT5747649.1 hypothetical protein [Gammaproteobacteria bacterium]MBT6652896.1 hypothetical protein [Gammaproteobacteria bacterium]MBT7829776.1 hypothetical protein [Candidatus Neomarinimicrobiota bacterium]